MSTKNVKRSLRTISAHGKLEAIRRVHDGESKASVARDIGVPESTLRGWCKNESKISYLSRQSSPDTDESIEPKDKRPKIEDPIVQPFNLSLKSATNIYTPTNSESLYTPMDYTKNDIDCTPKTPQNLSIKTETPKTASQITERERNRAELARLSVELGLNRPEMFTSNTNNTSSLADLAANINLLSQWNNILMQHQLNHKKVTPADTTTPSSSTLKQHNSIKLPKEQQSVEEYINSWLKTQEAMLGHSRSNGLPPVTTTSNTTSSMQSSWFWNWYKQLSYSQQSTAPPVTPEKPILYQQLTKEASDVENLSVDKSNNNKVKSVLDNLLHINNNNVSVEKKECMLSYSEAVEHGEKFLKWLESCSNPSVTAMQIMQFRALLSNVKNSADRKNGDLQNKTKVKRK